MKQVLFIILMITSVACAFSQDSLNKTDASRKKQGHWIKKDSAGRIIYDGQFRDDLPQGTFKYYFPGGSLKAILVYSPDGKSATSTTYFQNGKKNSEGRYIDQKKDGLWRFFSGFDELLVSEETYKGGVKDGQAKTYYSGKTVIEIITWKNGLRDGSWTQYFDDGKLKLEGSYKNDLKEGPFIVYYPTGQKFNTGQYVNGYPDGKWLTYDIDGKLLSTDIYDHGVLIRTDKKPKTPEKEIKSSPPDSPFDGTGDR